MDNFSSHGHCQATAAARAAAGKAAAAARQANREQHLKQLSAAAGPAKVLDREAYRLSQSGSYICEYWTSASNAAGPYR
jgi:hypothetical protein